MVFSQILFIFFPSALKGVIHSAVAICWTTAWERTGQGSCIVDSFVVTLLIQFFLWDYKIAHFPMGALEQCVGHPCVINTCLLILSSNSKTVRQQLLVIHHLSLPYCQAIYFNVGVSGSFIIWPHFDCHFPQYAVSK